MKYLVGSLVESCLIEKEGNCLSVEIPVLDVFKVVTRTRTS
jgi:hypothetical protein